MTPRSTPRRSRESTPARRRLSAAWISLIALFGCLCLAVGVLFTSPLGDRALSALRFMLGWYDVPQKQQQLHLALQDMAQQAGLDAQAYQRVSAQTQQRGRERWRLWRHRLLLPPRLSLMVFEQRLQQRLAALPLDILARRSREGDGQTSIAFTIGVANAPTDILMLTRLPAAALQATPGGGSVGAAGPRIAIVIDDMGWELPIAQDLFALKQPLSFAVLPQAPYHAKVAEAAHQHQRELLLHLPMEPHGYPKVNPGPHALLSTMSPEQLVAALQAALQALPQVIGVNNHMGSSLTENPEAMRVVMQELKQRQLFFLDSRTSAASKAYQIAREVGIPTARRHVFLDNDVEPARIAAQLHRLAEMASQQGDAIGIGHPYPETLRALEETLPRLSQAGVQIVPISRLVN